MKYKIKSYFESLEPKKLGLTHAIKATSLKRLGMGKSNLNYLVNANGKKFIFRMNMDSKIKNKFRKEFKALRIIEKYHIGPRAFVLDDSRKIFDSDFLIISYTEGIVINKTAEYFKPNMFSQIGKLCGKLHAIKVERNLRKIGKGAEAYGYKGYLRLVISREYIHYLNLQIKNRELLKIINETYDKLKRDIHNIKYKSELVLTQGDFCEQNVIVHKGKYKLIDFEDAKLTDRAGDLANIFVDFSIPFDQYQRELFLNSYLKVIKVNKNTLIRNINIWIPIKLFAIFLWSISHVYKIKNKEMHPRFIEQENMEKNLAYVKNIFKRDIKFGVISKRYKDFDIVKVIK